MHIRLWREKRVLERELMEAETSRSPSPVTDINALPENCIAKVLSLTNPPDACRLSLVGSTFWSAAESDTVWERFLPSDYQDMIARASEPPIFASKSFISASPIIPSLSMMALSGKKCFMIATRSLEVTWNGTEDWTWIYLPESRFTEVAELVDDCRVEICGNMSTQMLSPDTIYAAYFVFNWMTEAYGFETRTAESCVRLAGSHGRIRSFYLDPNGTGCIVPARVGHLATVTVPREGNDEYHPRERADGWLEMELGEHVNKSGEDGELEIHMRILRMNRECGIVVQGIEIRPKNSR